MRALFAFFLLFLSVHLFAQTQSNFIVVDQFGYLPDSKKMAIIRDPQTGWDASQSFTPGATYTLVNSANNQQVYTGTVTTWNGGATDVSSGDKVWYFDFSSYKTEGSYYVLDVQRNVKSYNFSIQQNIYKNVLIQAFKTFYYQRAGFAKVAPYAGTGWVDGASHVGNLQDPKCRQWGKAGDASTEKDVRGGWYDAGDLNKYTSWTAGYIIAMLQMYEENPVAWTDDFEIPESGNGTPDILDEAKFGLDHLLRLQFANGSCIAVIGESSASPPSAATGQSLWGGPSTSATLSCAAAYAYGASIFKKMGNTSYATTLQTAATNAWNWANANPSVTFYNNDGAYGTSGLAAGQQEVDDYGRLTKKLRAAMYLYQLTGTASYKTYFESTYTEVHLMQWWYVYPYEGENQDMLLYYTTIPGVSSTVVSEIISRYSTGMNGANQFQKIDNIADPYRAYLESYTWGSNNVHMIQGNTVYNVLQYNTNPTRTAEVKDICENYIHYIHGVNPLNKCYLSNMGSYGAENSVAEFYHTWFTDGSTKWDRVGTSTYGPAPGFLVGGPNPSYDWDGCCPGATCGSSQNNALCYAMSIEPPKNQPDQKSYKDFNSNWPLNSWSVTENSCGYQVQYLKLLSKYVKPVTVTPETQTISLVPGWNMVSTYIVAADMSVATVFPNATEVKTLDAYYNKNQAAYLNTLSEIVPGAGYLVNNTTTQSISLTGTKTTNTPTLKSGLNLVGCPFSVNTEFSTAFGTDFSTIQKILNFSGVWSPSGTKTIAELVPGKAYFVWK